MFDSHDLAPQRHATESYKAYRVRRAVMDRRIENYLRLGRVQYMHQRKAGRIS